MTDRWEADLKKAGGGRCKEEKTREQAERERADGQREIKKIQADGEKRKEKGRHSETDRWTDRNK